MDCKTAQDTLPLYFDGELDRAAGREFEAHLDACPDCRAALIELDALRTTLRRDAPRHVAPELLRKRIEKLAAAQTAAAQPVAPRRAARSAPRWLAYAASTVLAFAAGGMAVSLWDSPNRRSESAQASASAQLARDLFASHWRALAAASPVDVVSTDRHTVKPWFEGKIDIAPVVHDFAEQGFALVGGRIDYAGNARLPVLVYRHGQHLIDVFVLPGSATLASDAATPQSGYRLDAVKLGNQNAAIVSDMDQTELAHFAQLLTSVK
ncbi:zf-HC2 domain-containing protein [Rudaea sp.]|uniref:anti-sigma factor family protein n=1 Tax=Rudaea sp. TaxID=2136325 RepID=UPI00321F7ABC